MRIIDHFQYYIVEAQKSVNQMQPSDVDLGYVPGKPIVKVLKAPKKMRIFLIFVENTKSLTASIIDKEGKRIIINQTDLPKELHKLPTARAFQAFIEDVYVKISRSFSGDVSFSIHQRGRGGKPQPMFEAESRSDNPGERDLKQLEGNLKNFEQLDDSNKLSTIQEMGEILKNIHFQPAYHDVAIFLGHTGVGKSTLINYLVGADIKIKWSEEEDTFLDIPQASNYLKVGHGNVSCTTTPKKIVDEENGLAYLDCPGFLETRGLIHELVDMSYIQDVMNKAHRVKFIIVIPGDSFRSGSNEKLQLTINILEKYCNDFAQIQESILLVFTKIGDMDEESLQASLENLLKNHRLTEYQRRFIGFIFENNRFQLSFKDKYDDIEAVSVSRSERKRMIGCIKAMSPFIQSSEVKLKLQVSEEAENCIIEIANFLNLEIQRHLCMLGQGYQEEIKNIEESVNDLNDRYSLESFKNCFRKIIALEGKLDRIQNLSFHFVGDLIGELQKIFSEQNEEKNLQTIKSLIENLSWFEAMDFCWSVTDIDKWKQGLNDLSQKAQSLSEQCHSLKNRLPLNLPDEPEAAGIDEDIAKIEFDRARTFENYVNEEVEKLEFDPLIKSEEHYSQALTYSNKLKYYESYALMLCKTENQKKAWMAIDGLCRTYESRGEFEGGCNLFKCTSFDLFVF